MSTENKASKLIALCNKYQEYLSSGASVSSGLALSRALENYGLPLHAEALSIYLREGESDEFKLPEPWSSSKCYITQNPPESVEPLDLWFDPYELSFMVRTINPPGYGKGVIGWVSISPVYYWQYHVFQQLVKFDIRDDSFLQVSDLLASRPFGIDKWDYASDVYSEEARAYAFWHGKWLTSGICFEAFTKLFESEQLRAILPDGMSYWNADFAGDESSRGVFNLASKGTVQKYVAGEWDRTSDIGFATVIVDQVGLISNDVLPRESGECLSLLNCSRKIT